MKMRQNVKFSNSSASLSYMKRSEDICSDQIEFGNDHLNN